MHSQTLVYTDRSFILKAILIVFTFLLPFLIYFDTARSIVMIWNSSETFTHQYSILPISLWLIWQRREVLAQMKPEPYYPTMLLLAFCGFVWLLGNLADVQVVRQFAFVVMIILAVVSVLGRRISASIAFPLCFLLLAVPFGEIFIAPLIEFTANFTVAALRVTGIPVLREGNSFSIPSGRWSVIEACSGIRYLIASATLGCLYAYQTYRSPVRRAIFILISILVPIIANGLRAYMIVMIGHLSGMKLAVGVDHLIYGWLFFGLVMFLMFQIGSFWHEGPQKVSAKTKSNNAIPAQSSSPGPVHIGKLIVSTACILVCLGIWPLFAHIMGQTRNTPLQADLSNVHVSWQDAPAFTTWKPAVNPSNAELYRFFRSGTQTVGVSIHYYRNQHPGATLISSANRVLPEKDEVWTQLNASNRTESILGREISVREEMIQSASGSVLMWRWYWINGHLTANDYKGKLLQAQGKLLMQGDDGAALIVFAPYSDKPEIARQALHDFLSENLTPLETTLANNKKH
ncbi:exosortase A [Glaciimonas sp. GNP009]